MDCSASYWQAHSNYNIDIPVTDEGVEFVREYVYRASEDDSKNSSRKKALEQIKILLSEEIGVYIESYLEINKIVSSDVTGQDVSHEIKSLSSSITKIKVLDEKWDGKTYYVKASVKTNPEQAIETLLEAIKAKSAKSEIDRLSLIIAKQNAQLSQSKEKAIELQKELVRQELLYEARQTERIKAKKKLIRSNEEQLRQEKMLAEDRAEIKRINKIKERSKDRRLRISKKACLMEIGMTKDEVYDAIGTPEVGGRYNTIDYYGDIRIAYSHYVMRVKSVKGCMNLDW